MDEVPEVRFVRSGDASIAYTRWGSGPETVVWTPPLFSNVELIWELPEWERVCRRAGEHHQAVMLDKRGVGLSDRTALPPTLEQRVCDALAVLDAEKLGSVHLAGQSEGGIVALALAAWHPQRVRSLILLGAPAAGVPHEDVATFADEASPLPAPGEQAEMFRSLIRHWASPDSVNLALLSPRSAEDSRIRRWYRRYDRQSASPASVLATLRSYAGFDIRPLLGQVEVPTLVVHCSGDRMAHVSNGRYLANAIPGARYIEYSIDDHAWQLAPEWCQIMDDIIEFVTGRRPVASLQQALATVLFTDIVDSTSQESRMGDRRWRDVLDVHDRCAHDLITRGGGRIVKQTGDGILATFADPARAVDSALRFSAELQAIDLPIRAGLHTGQVQLRDDGDVSGIAVNIAARIQGKAQSSEVLVSGTLRELLLGSGYGFQDRGAHELKGVEGSWRLYAAAS